MGHCSAHQNRLAVYCDTCHTKICMKCTTSTHRGHRYSDIDTREHVSNSNLSQFETYVENKIKKMDAEEMKTPRNTNQETNNYSNQKQEASSPEQRAHSR